jgi:dTDP-glucose pyrophosphorylase
VREISDHIVQIGDSVRDALVKLDKLASDAILFLVDENQLLIGSITDGDLRRGFIKGLGFEDSLLKFIQQNPVFIKESNYTTEQLNEYKIRNLKIIPILDSENRIVDILNFRLKKTLIPAVAILMAGGEGKRLRPLTETTPKPLLLVGDKPIIEHNIDRLINVGIKKIHLSVNYLGEQIEAYFGNGSSKNISIDYVKETKPLGTIGSILLVDAFEQDDIIVMNSDILTTIDFEDFYQTYKKSGASMAVAATTYHVDVPYAVLETDSNQKVKSLKEKPRYTYYSNAGIYILNKSILKMIPEDQFFDITELMEKIVEMGLNLITYPINGYWLDIGKHDDYKRAQEDIKHLNL